MSSSDTPPVPAKKSWTMDWPQILGSLIVGAALGMAATFYLQGREIESLKAQIDALKSRQGSTDQSQLKDTPAPAAQIEVQWPQDGTRISLTKKDGPRDSNVKKFKASILGMPLSKYELFWRVDTDKLTEMKDSNEGGPHKESDVDFSGWDWKQEGEPYPITFVAKDSSGKVIAERPINIFIEHNQL